MKAYPYEKRDKNVLYKTGHFKTRIIELTEGEKLPPDEPCRMESHVIFYVVSGKIGITINGEYRVLEEDHCVISEPGSYQMEAKENSKLLGIQISNTAQYDKGFK
jgi:mannose-6-phosphate isomerase-like protein (cupin superfamily)